MTVALVPGSRFFCKCVRKLHVYFEPIAFGGVPLTSFDLLNQFESYGMRGAAQLVSLLRGTVLECITTASITAFFPGEITRRLSTPRKSATASETDRLKTRPLSCAITAGLPEHCRSVNRALARPGFGCCCVVVWFNRKKKKVCVLRVCLSLVLRNARCLLAAFLRLSWARPVLLFWESRVSSRRRGGGDERHLSTMSVTSVNAGCPCINVYIYSLTNIVPRRNPFSHLPSPVFPRCSLPWCY